MIERNLRLFIPILLVLATGCIPMSAPEPSADETIFLAVQRSDFGGSGALTVRSDSTLAQSTDVSLPSDLLEDVADDAAISVVASDVIVSVDQPEDDMISVASHSGQQTGAISFRVAPAGSVACASGVLAGTMQFSVENGVVTLINDTIELSRPARDLVLGADFTWCAETTGDFDGSVALTTVAFSFGRSAANQPKVELCHVPPSDPDNAHTIIIGAPGVDAHLAHGDQLGPCPAESEDGSDNSDGGTSGDDGEAADTDGDGVIDNADACPDTPGGETPDEAGCSCSQLDGDGDGVDDCIDACPDSAPAATIDLVGCEEDIFNDDDSDGVPNVNDVCPGTPTDASVDADGCACAQLDSDGDGVNDCNDTCPDTATGVAVGSTGCSVTQLDDDTDGVSNTTDLCPATPDGEEVDSNGCSCTQRDSDGDTVNDCEDLCPATPSTQSVDQTGCPLVLAVAGPDVTVGQVGCVTLTGSASGGTPPYSYRWSGDGWEGSVDATTSVVPSQTTVYTLTVTDSSTPQVTASDSMTVTLRPTEGLEYTIVDLGALNGFRSEALGMNDAGDVAGTLIIAPFIQRAFSVRGGVMVDLGTLGGTNAVAHDINNLGQVVGQSRVGSGDQHATLWEPDGTKIDLGTLGGVTSSANAINDAGIIVGDSTTGFARHSYIYEAGVMTDLGTPTQQQSLALAVNATSQVVGWLFPNEGSQLAFVWENDQFVFLGVELLSGSRAVAINDSGLWVGYSFATTSERSFLRVCDTAVDLGVMDGLPRIRARGVNNVGQIVGTARSSNGAAIRAFIYTGGQLIDLNDLLVTDHGWDVITDANDINTSGQIVGTGIIDGQIRAFIATPVP